MNKFCTSCNADGFSIPAGSETSPAYTAAGELSLPLEFTPFPTDVDEEGLFFVLKSGLSGLMIGFKRTLGDKKRLALVIALTIIWLMVNLLAALGISPLPVRLLSWLTAARGSLMVGTVGKGLVAALLTQIITDKSMFTALKSSLGQLGSTTKSGRGAVGPLLMGMGMALIACNMMISSNLQNTMVCIAAFLLSAKALTQKGFLRRLVTALLPKSNNNEVATVMGGWTLGFALFAAVSLLPGGRNGYILGVILLLAAVMTRFMGGKNSGKDKEAAV